jgi:hypothetical protein
MTNRAAEIAIFVWPFPVRALVSRISRHSRRDQRLLDAARVMTETFHRSGTNTEMGAQLTAAFVGAGLPKPQTATYTLTGSEPGMSDVFISLQPQIAALGIPVARLGDLRTLQERLMEEVGSRGRAVPLPQMMGAWARVPPRL